ncbi:MAG: hypothetical protein NT069_14510 [Planctomycetota bacterium]|nr:hypothetical protein [Planctomycetota bacterium]
MPYDGLLLPRHPAVFVGGEDLDQREYRRGVSSLIAAYRKAIGCKFEPEFEGRPISSRNVEDLWS